MTQFCISIAVFVAPLFAGLALQISKRLLGREVNNRVSETERQRNPVVPATPH